MQTYTQIHTHTHTHTNTYKHMQHTHTYKNIHTYNTRIHTKTYIHTRIHTYTHAIKVWREAERGRDGAVQALSASHPVYVGNAHPQDHGSCQVGTCVFSCITMHVGVGVVVLLLLVVVGVVVVVVVVVLLGSCVDLFWKGLHIAYRWCPWL